MAKIPSYEGDMSILNNHISIITFLRPGIIKIEKNDGNFEEFFVQDGTIEFFGENLVILSSSAINIKDLSKLAEPMDRPIVSNSSKNLHLLIEGQNFF